MNYFLLTSEYPPTYGGGIATYCFHTARMLARTGHHVTVFVGENSLPTSVTVEIRDDVRIIRFMPSQSEASLCLGAEARLSYDMAVVVARQIELEGPPDIIESQEYLGLPYFILQRRYTLDPFFQNIPVILTLHTPLFLCDLYNEGDQYTLPHYWLGEMERFSILAADGLISPSNYLMEALKHHLNIETKPHKVIPNPFESIGNTQIAAVEQKEGAIFFGRLEYRKGILFLLKQFARMWEDGLKMPLTLIGGDNFYIQRNRWMSDLIQEKYGRYIQEGLLSLEGSLPPDQLPERLQRAKIVFVPSHFENFPYTVVESMAAGAIVLVSTSGGQTEIVQDGISGFTFIIKEPDSLNEKVLKILDLNAKEIINIQANAIQRVQQYCSYTSILSQKIEFINDVQNQQLKGNNFPFIREIKKEHQNIPSTISVENILLSVVIPFYNAGETIEDTISSLVNIDYQNKEIIVIDDGSTDVNSLEILRSISQKYPIEVVRKDNGGLASARNTGAFHARGEYLAFLDADDTVDLRYYDRAIQILKKFDNVSFVGCWAKYFGETTGYWPAWNPELPYLLVHNLVVSGSMVYRKIDFLQSGINDLDYSIGLEDYESVIHMVENGFRGVVIPEPWFNYRIRAISMLHQLNGKAYTYLYSLNVKKHPQLFKSYGDEVICLLNANGPGFLYDNPTIYLPSVYLGKKPNPEEVDLKLYPHASTKMHLYLALRNLMMPLFRRLGGYKNPLIKTVKDILKSWVN